MSNCLFCGNITTNPKFCNQSCAASFNNSVSPKRVKKDTICENCGVKIKSQRKLCTNCHKQKNQSVITKWRLELEPLVNLGLSTRKISSKLGLSQTTINYRLKKCNLSTNISINTLGLTCFYCSKQLINNQSNFCSTTHRDLYYKYSDYYQNRHNKGKDIRNFLLGQCGAICSICGYKANSAALVFHHVKPEEKVFGINTNNCVFKNEQELLEELKKCILVCSNCHAELHNPSCNL